MPRPKKEQTSECWCGCGKAVPEGKDFVQGHDQKAAMRAIIVDWGSVREFVEDRGYGPGINDASLTVTYYEHMAKVSERRSRKKRP